jgi:cation diffusion facilitator family transporter
MGTQSKQGVALSSVFASLLLTGTKGVVGVLTGSLAILSEAAHSGLDMLAALLTYFAVRAGERPADEAHHFGHAKIESVSALIETGLLFLASAWIIREAVGRLLGGTHEVESNWYAVGVIVLSIVVDFSRALALKQAADALERQRLFARKAIGEASTPEEAVAPFAASAEASG